MEPNTERKKYFRPQQIVPGHPKWDAVVEAYKKYGNIKDTRRVAHVGNEVVSRVLRAEGLFEGREPAQKVARGHQRRLKSKEWDCDWDAPEIDVDGQSLPEKHRYFIHEYKFFCGILTHEQVAKRLGISTRFIRVLMHRSGDKRLIDQIKYEQQQTTIGVQQGKNEDRAVIASIL